MKNTFLKALIYTLWGLLSLLIGLYLTFPSELLGEIIVNRGEAQLQQMFPEGGGHS